MKTKNKLRTASMLLCIVIATNCYCQTLGYIGKGNGTIFVNTTTPIFENATGIGIGTTSPAYKLDVNGVINVPASSAFKMGGSNILWDNNLTSNIFVGVGTGALVTGGYNAFVGNNAGLSNGGWSYNTFIGSQAGYYFASLDNTCVGALAGYGDGSSGATGSDNTYIGYSSGYYTNTGQDNTCTGWGSGVNITSGSYNSIYGHGRYFIF